MTSASFVASASIGTLFEALTNLLHDLRLNKSRSGCKFGIDRSVWALIGRVELTATSSNSPMSSRTSLPQELISEVIDNLSRNVDVEVCSLVGRSWGYPARKRLFHHVRVRPEGVEDWLSRPRESVQRMAPHIAKFELSDWTRSRGTPAFCWGDTESLLTRLISSLVPSPVQWLRIESFGIMGFSKATLERCFEPISYSLHSLELGNLTACPDATRYLISLFPNLDDLHIGNILPTPTPSGWAGCGVNHSPKLSGTLQFFNTEGADDSGFFPSIASLSPRFRSISPGNITSSNWNAVRGLMEACAETVESVPLVWWQYAGTRCKC